MARMMIKEPDFTFGIEEEYLLVDPKTRDLVTEAPPALFEACAAKLGFQVSAEFIRSQIEIGTRICETPAQALADLKRLRGVIVEKAAEHGLAPMAASTHPFADWNRQKITNKARYSAIAHDLQITGRRLVICGMHVHVQLGDDDLRIDVMNQMRYFLPHLLALSSSSPFWQGADTGLKSYRLAIYDESPRSGLPGVFSSWHEYKSTVDVLVQADVIQDASKIWWDIRPSAKYPTLEMRITDVCTRLEDAVAISQLYRCLCRMLYRLRLSNQRWRPYPLFLLEENRWRAQRYGVGGTLFDFGKGALVPYAQLLDEIIERTREDAVHFGCEKEVAHARAIVSRGTSADRQLACAASARAGGATEPEAMRAVVDHLLAETAGRE
jgi:glutamate---cysteine ligase / carboxylate-amine ligase